jgi:hypothetical protein
VAAVTAGRGPVRCTRGPRAAENMTVSLTPATKDRAADRSQFAPLIEQRRAEERAANYEELRRDWFLGSEEFLRELLAAAVEQMGPNRYGVERHDTGRGKLSQSLQF